MSNLYRSREIDFCHEDERGILLQLVHEGFQQVNVLMSNAGVIRGGHYHKLTSEAFYVLSGSVEVELKRGGEQETVVFNKGDFFEIGPHTVHSMRFPVDCLMVQLYSVPVIKDGKKDIYAENDPTV